MRFAICLVLCVLFWGHFQLAGQGPLPEPGVMLLLGCGLLGLARAGRNQID